MGIIEIENVSLQYPVRIGGRERSIMAAAAATASFGRIAGDVKTVPQIEAVRDLNLSIASGEKVGLIGRNGSGKSTVLRAIAGHLYPASGRMSVNGDVTALFSLAAGANGDRTGRDNLKLMARLLKIAAADQGAFEKDVFEFTELGEFFDLPIRTYSAGMLIRYLFAAMTYSVSEILVVDEIIGAGDSFFFTKAKARAEQIFKKSNVFVMATHSEEILVEMCDRAIHLHRGRVVDDGKPAEVWRRYATGECS
mgnify:CR=1 FL=1